jgi:hypothetical protein
VVAPKSFQDMSSEQDQARIIAERVARRVKGGHASTMNNSPASAATGAPVPEELTAIRAGLHDLEDKLERIASKIVPPVVGSAAPTRARVIDFVSSGPPVSAAPSISAPTIAPPSDRIPAPTLMSANTEFVPPTHSPWVRDFPIDHPSQERFGVEEATVSELVEFFENEKKCSVEPGGKPCDHCAMCSSRGF